MLLTKAQVNQQTCLNFLPKALVLCSEAWHTPYLTRYFCKLIDLPYFQLSHSIKRANSNKRANSKRAESEILLLQSGIFFTLIIEFKPCSLAPFFVCDRSICSVGDSRDRSGGSLLLERFPTCLWLG